MHVETSVVNVAELLSTSKEVLIVPGYGMTVSRAQGSVGEKIAGTRELLSSSESILLLVVCQDK